MARAAPRLGSAAVCGLLRDASRRLFGATYLVEHRARNLYVVTDRPSFASLLELDGAGPELGACRAHLLDGESREVALAAAAVLGWYGDESGLGVALEHSTDANLAVSALATEALGLTGGEQARRQLEVLVRDGRYGLLGAVAAEALGRIADQRSLRPLENLARASSWPRLEPVRIAALRSMGAIGGESAVAPLAPYLAAEHNPRVRAAAAAALGRTLATGAVPMLSQALFLPDAAQPLDEIGDALHLLTYGGGSPSVGLGGSSTLRAARLWDVWWSEHGSAGAAGWRTIALARMFPRPESGVDPFDEDPVPILIVLLDSLRPWERRLAHDTLAEIAGDTVTIAPRALFDAADPGESLAAVAWSNWAAGLE